MNSPTRPRTRPCSWRRKPGALFGQACLATALAASMQAPADAASVAAPAASAPSSAAAQAIYDDAIGDAIGADVPAALGKLRGVSTAGVLAKDVAMRSCMLRRFAVDTPDAIGLDSLPAPAAAVLLAYRGYWHSVLMKRRPEAEAVRDLVAQLDHALGRKPAGGSVDDREPAIARLFARNGLHVLTGLTQPLHELMVWRSQQRRREHVALPLGTIDVVVLLLDDFVSYGWTGYATCDRVHTGGWAQKDALRAVLPSTPLGTDAYHASLLTHESQHYADYRHYPKLSQPDLEYRAKLAELWASRETTAKLLASFTSGMRRDRALPHPYAEFWVVTRLRERLAVDDLAAADPARVRAAAVDLLREHDRALGRAGPAKVVTALPD